MNYQGPFDKDEIETKEKNSEKAQDTTALKEDNQTFAGLPYWIWLFLLSVVLISFLGSVQWYQQYVDENKGKEPFLEVTNRELSVFLWQFPSFLRVHVPVKTGYLPGFAIDGEAVKLSDTEHVVSAPPDLLFLYHTWSRLLASDYIPRSIEPHSFEKFIDQTEEWLPENWKDAPKEYVDLISSKIYLEKKDLNELTLKELPLVVRQSYQGWKNYFEEGEAINQIDPTFGELYEFLKKHPTYARQYWRNIDSIADQEVAGLNYLKGTLDPTVKMEDKVPSSQLAPFLKVALFNAKEAGKPSP